MKNRQLGHVTVQNIKEKSTVGKHKFIAKKSRQLGSITLFQRKVRS